MAQDKITNARKDLRIGKEGDMTYSMISFRVVINSKPMNLELRIPYNNYHRYDESDIMEAIDYVVQCLDKGGD